MANFSGGGAERVFIQIANYLHNKGHRVLLIAASDAGPLANDLDVTLPRLILNKKNVRHAIFPLKKAFNREKFDVVLSALPHSNCVCIVSKILSKAKPVVVISERNYAQPLSWVKLNFTALKLNFAKWLLYRLSDRVVAVSEQVAAQVHRDYGVPKSRIEVILNPVDIEYLRAKAAEPITDPWFVKLRKPIIVGVGRLTVQKNFEALIKAVAVVKKKHVCSCLILGEGVLRNELANLAQAQGFDESDFALPGFELNPHKYLANSEVFVLPSKWEGFPNVLLQALALGVKTIATDCISGPREILEGGRYGILVSCSPAEIATAIEGCLGGNEFPKAAMCEYSPLRVMEHYEKVLRLELP